MPTDGTTVRGLLDLSRQLADASDSPMLDCQILLAQALGKPRTWLLAHDDETVDACTREKFARQLERRRQGEPLAYITGTKEFWSLEIRVTPDTLIPRAETELLVELALALIPEKEGIRAADLGTGSGAIAIALAHERPEWNLVATDISPAALTVARNNAERLGCANVVFIEADWFSALTGTFDIIVSNPPYVRTADPHLANLGHEPGQALIAGDDGLDEIRRIIEGASALLTADGFIILEHGYDQQAAVCDLLEAGGYRQIRTASDLSGQPRAVAAMTPERKQ